MREQKMNAVVVDVDLELNSVSTYSCNNWNNIYINNSTNKTRNTTDDDFVDEMRYNNSSTISPRS